MYASEERKSYQRKKESGIIKVGKVERKNKKIVEAKY